MINIFRLGLFFLSVDLLHATWPCHLMLTRTADFYKENLPSRPKKEIAEYVRSEGISVPEIYPSLESALSSGRSFVARSESPYEYEGASGMADSHVFGELQLAQALAPTQSVRQTTDPVGALARYLHQKNQAKTKGLSFDHLSAQREFEAALLRHSSTVSRLNSFAQLAGMNKEKKQDFLNSFGFSYWELLPGHNISMIADNAVKGRYHVFVKYGWTWGYAVIDNGKILHQGPVAVAKGANPRDFGYRKKLIGSPKELINFYERVRTLPRFDANHCPLLELQALGPGQYSFLQYHRTRDFEPANFTVNRQELLGAGYQEVPFVRGVTSKDGLNVELSLPSGPKESELQLNFAGYDNKEWGSVYRELQTRTARALFLDLDFQKAARDSLGHLPRSKLFNPWMTVLLPLKELQAKPGERVKVHVISDGRSAFYLRQPDSAQ